MDNNGIRFGFLILLLGFGLLFSSLGSAKTIEIGESTTITAHCSDPDGNLDQCEVTSPCTETCSVSGSSGSCSCSYTGSSFGDYNMCGEAVDSHGATDSSCPNTLHVVDNANPTTSIDSPSAPGCLNSNFEVKFSDDDDESGLDHCEYKVVNHSTTTVDWTNRPCNGNVMINLPSECTEGDETCTVYSKAVDGAGNEQVVHRSYSIDTTNPQITCNSCHYQEKDIMQFFPHITESSFCGLEEMKVCTSSTCSDTYCTNSTGGTTCSFNVTKRFGNCSFYKSKDYYIRAYDRAGNMGMTGPNVFSVKKIIGCNCTYSKQCLSGNCIGGTCFYVSGPSIVIG